MKTSYMTPETKVMIINAEHQLLAGSPGYGGSTDENGGNLSRRRGELWDDEEFDDED